MRVFGLPRPFYQIARHKPVELTPLAQERLRWIEAWERLRERGISSAEAAKLLGLARCTLYRWLGRLKELGLKGLEERSRRPKSLRRPTWTQELAQRVLELRDRFPRWGKDKLAVLLLRQGLEVSVSMVGRVLSWLRARGVLKEPLRRVLSARRKRSFRPYAIRKPRDYSPKAPGDLIQLDTLDIRPLPGVIIKHFTARDVVSRWDVLEAHTRATSNTSAQFLEALLHRMPFKVKALQVDGGSEFYASFEKACQEKGIRLFVLPPHSPKLNGAVERAQRTHTEEFYECYMGDLDMASLNASLLKWEQVYNTVRPHHALDGKTPKEYIMHYHPELALKLSHMY